MTKITSYAIAAQEGHQNNFLQNFDYFLKIFWR